MVILPSKSKLLDIGDVPTFVKIPPVTLIFAVPDRVELIWGNPFALKVSVRLVLFKVVAANEPTVKVPNIVQLPFNVFVLTPDVNDILPGKIAPLLVMVWLPIKVITFVDNIFHVWAELSVKLPVIVRRPPPGLITPVYPDVKVMDKFSFITVPFDEAEIIMRKLNTAGKSLVEKAKK